MMEDIISAWILEYIREMNEIHDSTARKKLTEV